jgi:hypothetical protein
LTLRRERLGRLTVRREWLGRPSLRRQWRAAGMADIRLRNSPALPGPWRCREAVSFKAISFAGSNHRLAPTFDAARDRLPPLFPEPTREALSGAFTASYRLITARKASRPTLHPAIANTMLTNGWLRYRGACPRLHPTSAPTDRNLRRKAVRPPVIIPVGLAVIPGPA